MNFRGKKVLILGGTGLTGRAIAKRAILRGASRVAVAGLYDSEALETINLLGRGRIRTEKLAGLSCYRRGRLLAFWGNMFVRTRFKDMSREELLSNPDVRQTLIEDTFLNLNDDILKSSYLYQLVTGFGPDIIYDSVNTATGLAYQNVYDSALDLYDRIKSGGEVSELAQKMLLTTYVPQLVRHMQILQAALRDSGAGFYLKVGTTGTGGMGWDIPYTHSEDRPSRVLLSKTAMAGAQSLLMFVLSRASGMPPVKELKPAAAIAWQGIGQGEILRGGKPIPVCDSEKPARIESRPFREVLGGAKFTETGENLRSVYIDTGENGLFSVGEFVALSSLNQMEFITPEEIADYAIYEAEGLSTGRNVIEAIEASVMGPTYRAGYLRQDALERLAAAERKNHSFPSVAFEILGPPRLSKLLFEAHILDMAYGDMRAVAKADPGEISARMASIVRSDAVVRRGALSIGIPILLPDGDLLAGKGVKIPPERERDMELTPGNLERWAHAGWIDTRPVNAESWIKRFRTIIQESESRSRYLRGGYMAASSDDRRFIKPDTLGVDYGINPGEIVAWVFINEEKGKRTRR